MKRFVLCLLCLALSCPLLAAEGFSSLEEQMTGKEFTAAGLDKLSPEELEALNEWIRNRSVATLDTPRRAAYAGPDDRGFEDRKMREMDDSPITSRIKGSFSGWDGNTVFVLENGMIWEQADNDTFFIPEVQNPQVVIEPGMFNTWRLHVEGYGSACRVERIQ